jgi:hypothetical protein
VTAPVSDAPRGDVAPLRLGIVVDDPVPPVWVGELVSALESATFVDLAVVIVSRPRVTKGLAHRLFGRLDQRLFASEDDPFLPSPASLPATAAWIDLDDPSLAATVTSASLDVILHLGEGRPPAELFDQPSVEIWWFERSGEPPYVADLVRGAPVSTTVLKARRRNASGDTVLACSVTRADLGSWHRTRATAYRQSTDLAVASLRKLEGGHVTASTADRETTKRPVRAHQLPKITARAVRRRIQWQLYAEQWLLAVRARRSPAGYPTDTRGFTPVVPPLDRSWADPFLAISDAGDRYVFFEDQPYDSRRGAIACAEIDATGLLTEPRTVLERSYHLSYPLVFRKEDDWFLLPESSENRTVELYRATRFPTDWELDRVLVEDVHVTDATPFEHDGRTWIFVSSETTTGHPTDAVSLFWADSLGGDWHPHPLNPVVSDVRSSRPGGRIISHDGRLIRPAQDGSRGYGCGLVFNEITRLTTTEYEERPLGRLAADWLAGSIGTHHYDADEAVEVVDVQRLIRRRRHATFR